jgi:hypothetical protein
MFWKRKPEVIERGGSPGPSPAPPPTSQDQIPEPPCDTRPWTPSGLSQPYGKDIWWALPDEQPSTVFADDLLERSVRHLLTEVDRAVEGGLMSSDAKVAVAARELAEYVGDVNFSGPFPGGNRWTDGVAPEED